MLGPYYIYIQVARRANNPYDHPNRNLFGNWSYELHIDLKYETGNKSQNDHQARDY